MTRPTNTIITRLIEYIVAVVGDTVKGIINVDYKAIVEVLAEVYFETIGRRSTMFIRSQIAGQIDTLLTSERRHIISFDRVRETSEIVRLLRPTSKAF